MQIEAVFFCVHLQRKKKANDEEKYKKIKKPENKKKGEKRVVMVSI